MKTGPKSLNFQQAVEQYLPDDQARQAKEGQDRQGTNQPAPDKLPIQDSVDLHGLTLEQARASVDRFLKYCADRGLRKVLIIHGKGSGILQSGIARFLEGHPLAGRRFRAKPAEGGSGALVVIIRQK